MTCVHLAYSTPIQSDTQLLPRVQRNDRATNLTAALAKLGYGPCPEGLTIDPDLQLASVLPEDPTIINVAHFIATLGQDDIAGQIPPQDFSTALYPRPVIRLRVPPSKRTIRREYVIWGVFLAVGHMMDYSPMGFVPSHYTLLFDEEEVGGVSFGIPATADGQVSTTERVTARGEPDDIGIVSRADPIGQGISAPNTIAQATNSRLSVICGYDGDNPLGKNDLLATLMLVMVQATIPPSDTRIQGEWAPGWLDGHTRFFARATGRATEPYLTYGRMIESLARAVDFLVNNNRYNHFSMTIGVDRVLVGQGWFRHR
ncbi:MAG: hypothetical protein Q9170_002889 [Blastenia crenularia]